MFCKRRAITFIIQEAESRSITPLLVGKATRANRLQTFFSVPVDSKYVSIFKHTCVTCGKTYKHKHHLKRHHDFECGVDPKFKCAFCPHKTRYKDSLMKHILARHQHFLEQNLQYGHQQIFEAHNDTEMNFHAQETNAFNVYPNDFTQNL
ncbi:transcriptional activator/repressor MOT3-like [Monomorium pharaonis]|uniref:transcriptional activator/repressor MOT3-like n=1 Tax=Monomorium pharaonis TaxID=307658 RepID=UPI001745C937|nr:transcriptional activator/repressor MOT3-like [Monomorium pharaonis]